MDDLMTRRRSSSHTWHHKMWCRKAAWLGHTYLSRRLRWLLCSFLSGWALEAGLALPLAPLACASVILVGALALPMHVSGIPRPAAPMMPVNIALFHVCSRLIIVYPLAISAECPPAAYHSGAELQVCAAWHPAFIWSAAQHGPASSCQE